MQWRKLAGGSAGLFAIALATAQAQSPAPDVDWDLLDTYCTECHNLDDQAGSIAFDLLPRDKMAADAQTWELAIRKMRTGMMPPAGKSRPDRPVFDHFIASLENRMDAEAAAEPPALDAAMGRLNRAEYVNAIRDLLAYDASAIIAMLPPDESAHGFDNLSEVLTISPTLIDAYVSAAMRIGREAVGDRTLIPTQTKYPAPRGEQTRHVEGLPLGTRGGMRVTHNFPLNATYEIRVNAGRAGGVFNSQAFCPQGPDVIVTLDGEPLTLDAPLAFQMAIAAGPHTLGIALADTQRCEGVNDLYDVYNMSGAIAGIEINGPFEAGGPGDTPSRRAIFSCHPSAASEEHACAQSILSRLATSAYRRPIGADAPETATLMQFYDKGRAAGDFETGIQYALARLLIDPRFLYQAEEEPAGLAPGTAYAISDMELASRLSFFLWSSIPDEELLATAAAGQLSEPAVLEAQTRRMLQDPKAKALVDNFAAQWLRLRELDAALPQDPAFNDKLRAAFRAETELLFTDLITQDLGVLHLFNADYTWLNETLARHYGIDGVRGDYMRRVTLPADSQRRGLLGHGSILTATSAANRTSPVIRGAWIVENLLGAPVPVPPPGVETDLSAESAPEGKTFNTLRERLEAHRSNPTCASCHQIMDPFGLALENFDLIGRWRDSENGFTLNTHTQMIDGTLIEGPAQLRDALLARSGSLVTTLTEKLLTYAIGRTLQPPDMPAVRAVVHQAASSDYRFSDLILGIVNSEPFLMKHAAARQAITAASLETPR